MLPRRLSLGILLKLTTVRCLASSLGPVFQTFWWCPWIGLQFISPAQQTGTKLKKMRHTHSQFSHFVKKKKRKIYVCICFNRKLNDNLCHIVSAKVSDCKLSFIKCKSLQFACHAKFKSQNLSFLLSSVIYTHFYDISILPSLANFHRLMSSN